MRTLVAAPHSDVKDYSFARWVAATDGYDRLVAIDEQEVDYAEKVVAMGVPVVSYEEPELDWIGHHRMCSEKFNAAWRAILDKSDGYTHILSLETDVIPPAGCDILSIMEAAKGDEDFLAHGVPWRESYNRQGFIAYEMGCTLGSVEAFREAVAVPGRLYNTIKGFNLREFVATALVHLDKKGGGNVTATLAE